jgi:hypothetical protein
MMELGVLSFLEPRYLPEYLFCEFRAYMYASGSSEDH